MSNSTKNVMLSIFTLGVLYYMCQGATEMRENFAGNMVPTKWRVNRVFGGPQKGSFMTVPGTFQNNLSPRMSGGVDFGSNIRYNMPSLKNMGVNPASPLNYANMVQPQNVCSCSQNSIKQVEGFCQSCNGAVGCRLGGGGAPMDNNNFVGPSTGFNNVQSGFAAGNFNQKDNNLNYIETTDMLPVQDMGTAVNAVGETINQPIVYDRFIYANQRSRLYALGDPIRGDLPIVPCKSEWFRPSVSPNIDLRDGAIAVMGGINNATSNELLALQNAAAGGLLDTGAGINFAVQKSSFLTHGGGDISIRSFP